MDRSRLKPRIDRTPTNELSPGSTLVLAAAQTVSTIRIPDAKPMTDRQLRAYTRLAERIVGVGQPRSRAAWAHSFSRRCWPRGHARPRQAVLADPTFCNELPGHDSVARACHGEDRLSGLDIN